MLAYRPGYSVAGRAKHHQANCRCLANPQAIARGELAEPNVIESKNELGTMTFALQAMVKGLSDKTDQAAIAGGNLTRSLTLSSRRDTLGKSLRQMNRQLNSAFKQIQSSSSVIASGSSDMKSAVKTFPMAPQNKLLPYNKSLPRLQN